jgi:Fe-S-cluster containining protein
MSGNGSASNGKLKHFELPLLSLPGSHPCQDCGACCTYVAAEIDAPTTARDYDQIHWYLTHSGVAVYIDWEGDWFLEFEARCDHLTSAKTCDAYGDRPELCSDFSWEECEKTTQEPGHKVRFIVPGEFFAWLEKQRPKAFERYSKFRRDLLKRRQKRSRANERARLSTAPDSSSRQSSTSI